MPTFIIPPKSLNLFSQCAADFISQLGKPCTLFYPPLMITCPNCVNGYNYLTGGPIPFTNGSNCPYCDGSNEIMSGETTDIVTMMVYYDPRDFIKYGDFSLVINDGVIQTRGLMSDLPKIQRTTYAIIHNNAQGMRQMKYIRQGEAVPFGATLSTEFLQFWKRDA